VLVLIDGLLAAQGTPQEIAQDATVRSRYLGTAFAAPTVLPEPSKAAHA